MYVLHYNTQVFANHIKFPLELIFTFKQHINQQ